MHNGLKPSLRGFKGVGFNRALPGAFDFGNGWFSDMTNDYFNIPGASGLVMPASFAVEFWTWWDGTNRQKNFFQVNFSDGSSYIAARMNNSAVQWLLGGGSWNNSAGGGFASGVNHIVLNCIFDGIDSCTTQTYRNGIVVGSASGRPVYTPVINNILIGGGAGTPFNGMNEFRFYKDGLTRDEVIANHNNGVGENPQNTEKLLLWYSFNEFEMLDTSLGQDNSSIQLALRDRGGAGKYHAVPLNQITDPANAGYVLKNWKTTTGT